jgi:hypothetical protein
VYVQIERLPKPAVQILRWFLLWCLEFGPLAQIQEYRVVSRRNLVVQKSAFRFFYSGSTYFSKEIVLDPQKSVSFNIFRANPAVKSSDVCASRSFQKVSLGKLGLV